MNKTQALSFLDTTFTRIYPQDMDFRRQAEERLNQLAMPHWALGDLMDLAVELVGICRTMQPPVSRKKVVVMVGDHGVVSEGVTCYPAEVTTQQVLNFVSGGAGINVLSRCAGAEICVVDVGATDDFTELVQRGAILSRKVGRGTANMARGPAMSRTHAVLALEAGIEVANSLAAETDVFATGEMGIGNTTPSAAIAAVLTGRPVAEVTGRGAGIDDVGLERKRAVVQQALDCNRPNARDGIDIIAKVGGFEIAALAGLAIGAAANRKPILIDGFISTAGAALACNLEPFVRDYLICAHESAEPGHKALLQLLGRKPLLDLKLRLGEGTGAALAMPLVDAAVAILTEMSTFAEAGVSGAH